MKTRPETVRGRAAWLLAAGTLLCTLATSVTAMTPFGAAPPGERSVFCDMAEIRGTFSPTDARYLSKGACVQLEAMQVNEPSKPGTSEFADYRGAKELFRVAWTAEGGYNPATKEAWETITLPAPQIDEPSAVGRPYGRVVSKRVCETDPWLDSSAANKCTGGQVSTTGNLGDAAKRLSTTGGPFTKPRKLLQTQALNDAQQLYLKRRAQAVPTTAQGKTAQKVFPLPEIVQPVAGSTHAPQTPMRIRVARPWNEKVLSYLLQFEFRQPNGSWLTTTNVPVSAAEVEGPRGYNGWGWHQPGTGLAMTATVGAYRVRAKATAPTQGEPGEWREFNVAGVPGPAPDELQVNRVTGATALKRASAGTGLAAPSTASTLAPERGVLSNRSAAPVTPMAPLQPAATTLGAGVKSGATLDWNQAAPGANPSQLQQRSRP